MTKKGRPEPLVKEPYRKEVATKSLIHSEVLIYMRSKPIYVNQLLNLLNNEHKPLKILYKNGKQQKSQASLWEQIKYLLKLGFVIEVEDDKTRRYNTKLYRVDFSKVVEAFIRHTLAFYATTSSKNFFKEVIDQNTQELIKNLDGFKSNEYIQGFFKGVFEELYHANRSLTLSELFDDVLKLGLFHKAIDIYESEGKSEDVQTYTSLKEMQRKLAIKQSLSKSDKQQLAEVINELSTNRFAELVNFAECLPNISENYDVSLHYVCSYWSKKKE